MRMPSLEEVELAPSLEQPLLPVDGLRRALLAFTLRDAERMAPERCPALPCAKSFPGEVPQAAPRVTRSVAIDTAVPRWHSTGLYAAPGEVVVLRLPKAAEGRDPAGAGLMLQIGAHTDEIYELEEWQRAPALVRRVALDREQVAAASPVGGLLYVVVPDGCTLGTIAVEFAHAVESPSFVLGRTTLDEWKGAQRHRAAPWAELSSGKIALTVPSSAVRGLEDPEALLRLWDRVADAAADLVALPRARASPERYVADVQIAAGYMHSGYPLMTHLDAAAAMTDAAQLARGDWGLFHELGHNHQDEDWTFEGAGEVTNNVICLYILDTVCGRKPRDAGELCRGVDEGAKRVAAYLAGGAKFDEWKSEPFLALQMYIQLQQAFGWEPYRKAFAEYRGLPRRDQPKNDDARRDLWLVTMSRACQKDLGSFFTAWGVPTSESARQSVAALDDWMPDGFPPR